MATWGASRREVVQEGDGRPGHLLARGLGWVSLGIGLAELKAPGRVRSMLGLDERRGHGMLWVLGLREILHGVGILTSPDGSPRLTASVGSRLAGDVLDGVLLVLAATRTRHPARFALTAGLVGLVVLADVICARWLQGREATRATWGDLRPAMGSVRHRA